MEDLIKRLRSMARYEHDDLSIGNEAADALEAQQARIAELLAVLKRCYMLDLHNDALLTDVVNAISRTDDMSALAAHNAEVRKAALLEAAEWFQDQGEWRDGGWVTPNPEKELRRMAEGEQK